MPKGRRVTRRKAAFPPLKARLGQARTIYATPNKTQAIRAKASLTRVGKSSIRSLSVQPAAGGGGHVVRVRPIHIA